MTTRQHIHTWRTRLLALFIYAQPGDPAGPKAEYQSTPRMVRVSCLFLPPFRLPFPPGGFRLQWTRCRAEPQLLEPSSLQPRCWGEDGLVKECRVAEVLSIETHRRATIGNTRSREASRTAGGPRSLGQRPSDLAHTLAWSR
jgi:hypothetical protein